MVINEWWTVSGWLKPGCGVGVKFLGWGVTIIHEVSGLTRLPWDPLRTNGVGLQH